MLADSDILTRGRFSLAELIHWLGIIDIRWPGATLGRSANGTGNTVVYQDGEYRALLELRAPVCLTAF
ncbi:Uncharacterised protein [Mycobacteroides abscessus subsp. abscessus]|nr:hypothetical protein B9M83_08935 [Mycobacteroides abscessus]SHU64776.1 Uncharacterised protein [Mycobacteroides abscessus subsp. abscessus]OTR15019.1 hypothetical protein B9M82_09515 [Mycobacteroides abscessus]SIB71099.1 Uncharacterised protein [Mycobacteroides abscessus subsp. abscessus]SII78354.1 Uncharacterised protein [Mycobacteroides abscessus subsp. abscessus]